MLKSHVAFDELVFWQIIKVNTTKTKVFNVAVNSYASNKIFPSWVRATSYRKTLLSRYLSPISMNLTFVEETDGRRRRTARGPRPSCSRCFPSDRFVRSGWRKEETGSGWNDRSLKTGFETRLEKRCKTNQINFTCTQCDQIGQFFQSSVGKYFYKSKCM